MENAKKKILIVEDEKTISEILEYTITREGYEAVCTYDGITALELALGGNFDLILLDVMLPGIDGFEVCSKVREVLDTPIIMLTAREEEADKVQGLELGADDYITKPFDTKELVARIKAVLRRTTQVKETDVKEVKYDKLTVNDRELNIIIEVDEVTNLNILCMVLVIVLAHASISTSMTVIFAIAFTPCKSRGLVEGVNLMR